MIREADNPIDVGESEYVRPAIVVGGIGVPLYISASFLDTLTMAMDIEMGYLSSYVVASRIISVIAGLTSSVFITVGFVGVMKRHRSALWILFIVMYAINWIWSYIVAYLFTFSYAIDMIWGHQALGIIANTLLVVPLSYALWTIRDAVGNRSMLLSLASLMILAPWAILVASALFGVGLKSVSSWTEVVIYEMPSMIKSVVFGLAYLAFFLSEYRAEGEKRSQRQRVG